MSTLDDEKRFYERFTALMSNRDLVRVFDRYGPAVLRRSSVLEGFEKFLNATKFRGDTCVEIGTLKGLTAVVLARRFRRVITIDNVDDPDKYEIAHMLGVDNVINFINVNSNAQKAAVINAINAFDAAYVDADHARDTETDFALVRRGGRVLFHEYWDAQPAVVQLVDSLRPNVITEGKWALWTA